MNDLDTFRFKKSYNENSCSIHAYYSIEERTKEDMDKAWALWFSMNYRVELFQGNLYRHALETVLITKNRVVLGYKGYVHTIKRGEVGEALDTVKDEEAVKWFLSESNVTLGYWIRHNGVLSKMRGAIISEKFGF